MYEIIVLIIIWILLPLFLIPYSLILRSKNKKLKNMLGMYEGGCGMGYRPVNNDHLVQPHGNSFNCSNQRMNNYADSESDLKYAYTVQQKRESRSVNISLLLIIGVILVILAGLIFATTSWSDMSNLVRTLTVISGSIFFYAVSAFSDKKLKLKTTAKAFYILGCFFLPVSVVAIAFFKTFGTWFSFTGDGFNIVFMVIFLISSVAAAAGVYKYQFRSFAIISMTSFSLALFSLLSYSDCSALVTVVLAAYSFFMMMVKYEETEKTKWFRPYFDVIKPFSKINVIALGLVSFCYSFYDPWASIQPALSAFAVLFIMAGTEAIVFRSENESDKNIVKSVLACEYIVFAVFFVSQIAEVTYCSDQLLCHIFSCMFVPAFILFRFVPKTKSRISEMLMIITEFFIAVMSDDTSKLPAFLFIAFLVSCAVTEKENIFKEIYAAVLPAAVFVPIYSFDMSSLNYAYIYISILSAAAVISALFLQKSDMLKKISLSSCIYVIVITPLIVILTETEEYTDLLVISSVMFVALVAYLAVKKEKKYIYVPVIAASLDIQFYGFMKFINTGYFDTDTTALYLISVIVTLVIISSGFLLLRRYEVIGKHLVKTSALFISLVLVYDFPEQAGNWRFVFTLCYAGIIAACSYVLTDKCVKKIMLSIAAGLVSVALMTQKFIEIPQLIRDEYYVTASLFMHVFLHRIWKEKHEGYSLALLIHSGLGIFILMMCAMVSDKPEDAIILASVCSVIIIGSYVLKSRRWFYFGSGSLLILVLYITRDFWLSIAWWVYLLTAGIVFISFAGLNEYCKTTGKENHILSKIKSFMGKEK